MNDCKPLRHGLKTYCNVAGGGGGGGASTASTLWCVDAARVCAAKASQLLDSAPGAGRGGVAVGGGGGGSGGGAARWRMGEFMAKWKGLLPEELRNGCDDSLLKGLALIEKAADGSDGVVRPYRSDHLSKVPKERFDALFALKPRWGAAR
jgi:hypothetical protein